MSERNIFTHTQPIEREEELRLISEIDRNPELTQRELSARMNMSLGKTNYLLNSLLHKGLLKMRGFTGSGGKLRKVKYILTPEGFEAKVRQTYYFLKKKEQEYMELKAEWELLNQHLPVKGERG